MLIGGGKALQDIRVLKDGDKALVKGNLIIFGGLMALAVVLEGLRTKYEKYTHANATDLLYSLKIRHYLLTHLKFKGQKTR